MSKDFIKTDLEQFKNFDKNQFSLLKKRIYMQGHRAGERMKDRLIDQQKPRLRDDKWLKYLIIYLLAANVIVAAMIYFK